MLSSRHDKLIKAADQQGVNAAIDAAVIGTWDWHIRENKVYANERFARVYGVEPALAAAGTAVEDFLAGIHIEDRERVRQQIIATVANGTLYTEEYRVVGTDGTVRWVLARGRCLRDDQGRPVRFPGAVTEITERKNREEAERVLVAEMHHRFRNVLAMVQAIAQETLKDDRPIAESRDAFMQRIAATGVAFKGLTGPTRSSADVHSLVTASITALSDPARFRITGDAVTVGPDQALSLTLALHELITNAMKYGALLSPDGTVELRWSVDQESGIFSMDWRETGGPETHEPIRKGFGTFLLKRNVAAEFGGNVRLSYQPSGLEWHLKAPLSALLRL